MCVYEPFAGLKRGRCTGHSAIPVFTEDHPYDVLHRLDDPSRIVQTAQLSASDGVYARGFATLALHSEGTAEAEYFQIGNGAAVQVHREIID